MIIWPRSLLAQLAISFVGAGIASYFVAGHVSDAQFLVYARQYPHDGQDGLGAMMDGLAAGGITFVAAFFGFFVAQRIATRRRS